MIVCVCLKKNASYARKLQLRDLMYYSSFRFIPCVYVFFGQNKMSRQSILIFYLLDMRRCDSRVLKQGRKFKDSSGKGGIICLVFADLLRYWNKSIEIFRHLLSGCANNAIEYYLGCHCAHQNVEESEMCVLDH